MEFDNDKKDYEKIVNSNIIKAKLLYNVSQEGQEAIVKLLDEKERILHENGFFANYQLKQIDKKIQKIQKKFKK